MSAKTHPGQFSFANLSQLHVVEAHTSVFFFLDPGSLVLPVPHEDQYFTPSLLLFVAVGGFVLWCAKTQALESTDGVCAVALQCPEG